MNISLSDITESPDKEYVTFNVTMGEPFRTEIESSSSFDEIIWIIEKSSSSSWIPYSTPSYSFSGPFSASSVVSLKNTQQPMRVISQNGIINIQTPLQGTKTIRMFSLNGQLLFETPMDGSELQFQWPKHLGKQRAVLSVMQGSKSLFMGTMTGF